MTIKVMYLNLKDDKSKGSWIFIFIFLDFS